MVDELERLDAAIARADFPPMTAPFYGQWTSEEAAAAVRERDRLVGIRDRLLLRMERAALSGREPSLAARGGRDQVPTPSRPESVVCKRKEAA